MLGNHCYKYLVGCDNLRQKTIYNFALGGPTTLELQLYYYYYENHLYGLGLDDKSQLLVKTRDFWANTF